MRNAIGLKLGMSSIAITASGAIVFDDYKRHVVTNEDEQNYYIERDMGAGWETVAIKKMLSGDENTDCSSWLAGQESVIELGSDSSQVVAQVFIKNITHPETQEPVISFHTYVPCFDLDYDDEFGLICANSFIEQANEYLATAKGFEKIILCLGDGVIDVGERHYCNHCGQEQDAA